MKKRELRRSNRTTLVALGMVTAVTATATITAAAQTDEMTVKNSAQNTGRDQSRGHHRHVKIHKQAAGYYRRRTELRGLHTQKSLVSKQDLVRAKRYEAEFVKAGNRFNIDPRILWCVAWKETKFESRDKSGRPRRSNKGAIGLMQFMPDTAARFKIDPTDDRASIHAAAQYLRILLDRYQGDIAAALAAYNSGEATVDAYREGKRIILKSGKIINPMRRRTAQGIPPYAQTIDYVAKANQIWQTMNWEESFPVTTLTATSTITSKPETFGTETPAGQIAKQRAERERLDNEISDTILVASTYANQHRANGQNEIRNVALGSLSDTPHGSQVQPASLIIKTKKEETMQAGQQGISPNNIRQIGNASVIKSIIVRHPARVNTKTAIATPVIPRNDVLRAEQKETTPENNIHRDIFSGDRFIIVASVQGKSK